MRLLVLMMMTVVAGLPAGSDPEGFKLWKSADLKGAEKRLSAKLDATKSAGEAFGAVGNHSFSISHREADGTAEVHEKVSDIFVVESGEATLVVGGKLDAAQTTAPNEIRGTSITGGVEKKLATGDVVHIPSNTPHQLKLAAGKHFTYFVIKVKD
jgi:mannose-6-phosphate isomerase-like protein (cupin superfamily)